MKERYEDPAMRIVWIEDEDVITTSGDMINGGNGDGDGDNFDNL